MHDRGQESGAAGAQAGLKGASMLLVLQRCLAMLLLSSGPVELQQPAKPLGAFDSFTHVPNIAGLAVVGLTGSAVCLTAVIASCWC